MQSPAIVDFPEITASPNFFEYSLKNVATVMKIDRELFGGGSEKEIFKAVIKWTMSPGHPTLRRAAGG